MTTKLTQTKRRPFTAIEKRFSSTCLIVSCYRTRIRRDHNRRSQIYLLKMKSAGTLLHRKGSEQVPKKIAITIMANKNLSQQPMKSTLHCRMSCLHGHTPCPKSLRAIRVYHEIQKANNTSRFLTAKHFADVQDALLRIAEQSQGNNLEPTFSSCELESYIQDEDWSASRSEVGARGVTLAGQPWLEETLSDG